jgi:hypothetical protein
VTIGVPDAIYSMFLEGKEYLVYSLSLGLGFSKRVASIVFGQ